jgi:hypothetical protein
LSHNLICILTNSRCNSSIISVCLELIMIADGIPFHVPLFSTFVELQLSS